MQTIENKTILAIDIGGSKIMMGVVDFDGQVLERHIFPIVDSSQDWLMDTITKVGLALRVKYPDSVCAGVSIPGLCDAENGIWEYACFRASGVSLFVTF